MPLCRAWENPPEERSCKSDGNVDNLTTRSLLLLHLTAPDQILRTMLSSSKPSVSLSRVPSVKELCEHLGFQYASLKDTNAFMDVTRAWRKSYTTSSGHPATALLQWNDSSTQLDLEEMAEAFLDQEDNGDRFWSPNRSWHHGSNVQYPEDKAK